MRRNKADFYTQDGVGRQLRTLHHKPEKLLLRSGLEPSGILRVSTWHFLLSLPKNQPNRGNRTHTAFFAGCFMVESMSNQKVRRLGCDQRAENRISHS